MSEKENRIIRDLRRDIRMGALAGLLLIACAAVIAFALALTLGEP